MNSTYIHGTSAIEQERLSSLNKITNQSFICYLGDCNNLRICDFGCGLGNLINDIISKFPFAEITGIEISEGQYQNALRNTQPSNQVHLLQNDIFNNSIEKDYFDITYCRYVLEHVGKPIQAAKEMLRVTKPGGRVVCQENDLHNVIYYPDIRGHDILMEQYCNLQRELHGDPFIGRKLFTIFHNAGAKEISLEYAPEIYSADNPEPYKAWMRNSLNIFLGVREKMLEKQLVSESLFDSVCSQLEDRINRPKGIALFHWNRVTAYKASS